MMNRWLLLLSIVMISIHAKPQVIVTGRLVDSISGTPVGYASIGVSGTNKNTISNEQGRFTLKVDSLPCVMDVFLIGYAPQKVAVMGAEEMVVVMSPLAYSLQEVIVKGDEADLLFKKAYQKLKKQKADIYKGKSFFRLVTKNDRTYTEMIENFYDTWLGKTGVVSWELAHGRYARIKNHKENRYVLSLDFSELTRYLNLVNSPDADISYPLFPFDPYAAKAFIFTIGQRYNYQGQEIARVDFTAKSGSGCSKCYKGSMYIDASTFDLYRIKLECVDMKKPPVKINDSQGDIAHFTLLFDLTFKPNSNHRMYLNHIHMSMQYEVINKITRKLNHRVSTYSDLLVYDMDDAPVKRRKEIPYSAGNYDTDYNRIKQRLYIKRFWDNNPILAETPLEKGVREDFEKAGSFGKTFNNSNDTLELIKDGYLIWDNKHAVSFNEIPNKEDKGVRMDKLELYLRNPNDRMDTTRYKAGGLYAELFFAWNCYKDTFYYYAFPLLDIKATWAADTIREGDMLSVYGTETVYQYYFNLLEAHKRKFRYNLSQVTDICEHKMVVDKLYDQAQDEFYKESVSMLSEVWTSSKKKYLWYHRIDDMLEKYKAFE